MSPQAFSEDDARKHWAAIAHRAFELTDLSQTRDAWPVALSSPLEADDRKSHPYCTSHAAVTALGAAVDHLHALCTLIIEANVLHTRADFTLARGCLENAAYALWIVGPESSEERLSRTFRWFAEDMRDGDRAARQAGIAVPRPLDDRLQDLKAAADRAGVTAHEATNPVRATAVMKDADDVSNRPGTIGALFAWQLCSGFAHGRGWATLGALTNERMPSEREGVVHLRQTNSLSTALYPALAARQLLDLAIETFEKRARVHL